MQYLHIHVEYYGNIYVLSKLVKSNFILINSIFFDSGSQVKQKLSFK